LLRLPLIATKALKVSALNDTARVASLAVLSQFRTDFYHCLTARADALFELTDAVLCTDGLAKTLVDLTLAPEHRRGHGALYDGLNSGRIELARWRRSLSALPLPRTAEGRIVLAVDVSPWLRSDAPTSAERLFCHVYGRAKSASQFIPGWPYSFVAALESGRTSWTAVLDAVRLGPEDDATAVTATQLREVIQRLRDADQWREGDADILILADAGYDATRLAFLLADLPVELLGRIRSDRVLQLPAPPRLPGTNERPPKHGGPFTLGDPATWPAPQHATTTGTTRYGTATANSWNRLHPRLTHRSAWLEHQGELPILGGTLIRLQLSACPATASPSRYGYGPRAPAPPRSKWTCSGRRSSADSILNIPSGSSNKHLDGPHPRSGPLRPPTGRAAGQGSRSRQRGQWRGGQHHCQQHRQRPAAHPSLRPERRAQRRIVLLPGRRLLVHLRPGQAGH
jgi:hypothetical protein